MRNIFRNWKTSLLGGGVLSAGITLIIADPNQWKVGAVTCITGLLGLFAKDSDVTGKGL